MEALADFVQRTWPHPFVAATVGPAAILWAVLSIAVSGRLRKRGVAAGYTRKLFHILIFFAAAAVQVTYGLPGVCVFGAGVSLVIFYAVFRGDGHPWYEALARPKDAPHRTLFILVPYVSTALGGVLANIFFGTAAVAGYLVTGLGDAVGEPVGARWGRHPYRVPSMAGVPATRTWEGSAAVAVATMLMFAVALGLQGTAVEPGPWFTSIVVGAAVCTVVEATTPHGWDNLTLQIAASGVFFAVG